MGKNKSSGVVAIRLDYQVIAALTRMAEAREISVNAMLGTMITRRIEEIRTKEGW